MLSSRIICQTAEAHCSIAHLFGDHQIGATCLLAGMMSEQFYSCVQKTESASPAWRNVVADQILDLPNPDGSFRQVRAAVVAVMPKQEFDEVCQVIIPLGAFAGSQSMHICKDDNPPVQVALTLNAKE